jgi:hypothetical protein
MNPIKLEDEYINLVKSENEKYDRLVASMTGVDQVSLVINDNYFQAKLKKRLEKDILSKESDSYSGYKNLEDAKIEGRDIDNFNVDAER